MKKENVRPVYKNYVFWVAILLIFAVAIFVLYSTFTSTGKAVASIKQDYNVGENLEGVIKLSMKEGELIPANSILRVSLGNYSNDYLFRDLTDEQSLNGEFYVEGVSLSESGEGFGVEGKKVVYPEISFDLAVSCSDSGDSSDIVENDSSEEISVEVSAAEWQAVEETPVMEDVNLITGNTVSPREFEVSGEASKEKDFEYSLDEGCYVEVVAGSVKDGENVLGDGVLDLSVVNNNVIVKTSYQKEETGFGADYLGDIKKTISLDLNILNLSVSDDLLSIEFIYEGVDFAKIERQIYVHENDSVVEEDLENSSLILIKDIPSIRMKVNESYLLNLSEYFVGAENYELSLNNFSVDLDDGSLTLTPEENFKGVRRAQIIASDSLGSVKINEFNVMVSSGNINVRTERDQIKVGEKVRWVQNISLEVPEQIVVQLPAGAENISVSDAENSDINVNSLLTGNVVISLEAKEPTFVEKIANKVSQFFNNLVTGNAISELDFAQSENSTELVIAENSTEYSIEYYTEAPVATENETSYGKQVVISAADELNYTDVLSFTNISEIYNIGEEGNISVYWVEESQYVLFDAYDMDGDGKLDYVEWVTPHLSDQTFEIRYGIMSTPGEIGECQVIDTPGVYTLNQTITDIVGTCFLVTSDNVTIDGNGFSINGPGTGGFDYGVDAYENNMHSNISIVNFSGIISFYAGVKIGGSNNYIGNNVFEHNFRAIDFYSMNSVVENNIGSNNDIGIEFSPAYSNNITNNNLETFEIYTDSSGNSFYGGSVSSVSCYGSGENNNYGLSYTTQTGCDAWITPFAGGNGTAENPYQIDSWAALNATRNNLTAYYVLTANLSSATSGYVGIGDGWVPIGDIDFPFSGNFNGQNNTISDLILNLPDYPQSWPVGLFGHIDATIINVRLNNVNVTGNGYSPTGALVGWFNSGVISNCYSSGNVYGIATLGGLVGSSFGLIKDSHSDVNILYTGSGESPDAIFGGLVAYAFGNISNCYATGNVIGYREVGGLAGRVDSEVAGIFNSYANGSVSGNNMVGGFSGSINRGVISNSYAAGSVDGEGSYVGGLVGYDHAFGGSISNSYATGTVTGLDNFVGGLAGQFSGTISNSYAIGSVGGVSIVGGLVGENDGTIDNSYSTGNVFGSGSQTGGLVGYSAPLAVISNSYSVGSVNGFGPEVGGLVGGAYGSIFNSYSNSNIVSTADYAGGFVGVLSGTINNSNSSGTVTGADQAGGLVGYQLGGEISNSNAIGGVFGTTDIGGLVGSQNAGTIYNSYSTGNIVGSDNLGGLVGYQTSGTINHSYATGSITGTNDYVGGFGGFLGGLVINSYATGTVNTFGDYVGGFVGWTAGTIAISNSYSTGNVTGSSNVGGFAGRHDEGLISNSYSTGNVTGSSNVGGLIGRKEVGTISTSYSTGAVSGSSLAGGLIGYSAGSIITDSFWNIQTSGQATSDGGIGKTTAQMKNIFTYDVGGWNISSNVSDVNSYPYLAWQTNDNNYVWMINQAPSSDIVDCRYVTSAGEYNLLNDISAGEGNDCLLIRADGVTINGNGFTVTGNVNATNNGVDGGGSGNGAYTNLNLMNITVVGNFEASGGDGAEALGGSGGNGAIVSLVSTNVTGNLTSFGGEGYDSIGGNGGSVTLTSSSIAGNINAYGGDSTADLGGDGAIVNLNDSIVSGINSYGGIALGSGGAVTAINSNISFINSYGGGGIPSGLGGGGNGGAVTLTSSNVIDKINSYGGISGSHLLPGGSGGDNVLINSSVGGGIDSFGGSGDLNSGGAGGLINLTSSSIVGNINVYGGFSYTVSGSDQGGSGGEVVMVSSNMTGNISSYGGESIGDYSGSGGAGGLISISASNITVGNIIIYGGNSGLGIGGNGGIVTINHSTLNSDWSTNVAGGVGATANGIDGSVNYLLYNCDSDLNLGSPINYVLQNDITGDCNVRADNVTIDGNGFTVTGNVNATNASVCDYVGSPGSCDAFTNLNLINLNLVGSALLSAADSDLGDAGSGGSVSVFNSIISFIISEGGDGIYGSGSGGTITINKSVVTSVGTSGGDLPGNGQARSGGNIIIVGNSNVTSISSEGGSAEDSAGNGGSFLINDSFVGSMNTLGGDRFDGNGIGGSGSVTAFNSTLGTINTFGFSSGSGASGAAGGSVTLNLSNVTGNINAKGGDSYGDAGNGGAINISSSNVTGNISSVGGSGDSGAVGGSINIILSNVKIIDASGGAAVMGGGKDGGTVNVVNSSATIITTIGGASSMWEPGNGGQVNINFSNATTINTFGGVAFGSSSGNGGAVTLISSNVTTINAYGTDTDSAQGGSGATITVASSNITSIDAHGGKGGGIGGGSGGIAIISNSNIGLVNIIGGITDAGIPGAAGSANITSSNVTAINAYGANGGYFSIGGSGATITATSSNITSIDAHGGIAEVNGTGGQIILNNSRINLSGGINIGEDNTGSVQLIQSTLFNEFGELKYLVNVVNPNALVHSILSEGIMQIGNNYAYVNSSIYRFSDINKSANITLNLSRLEIVNPQILKNGALCAAPRCNILSYNTTSKMIKFNVSSWSNYTISEVTFAGGSGTAGDPYQINSWYGLDKIRTNLTAHYILTANLSAATQYYSGLGNSWVPIGDCGGDSCGSGAVDNPFMGNFNGNGNTVSNLTISAGAGQGVGLFGFIAGSSPMISNIGLINVSISGTDSVGGLVGYQYGGVISNSYSTGSVLSSFNNVGGLVGMQYSGIINNSYSRGTASCSNSMAIGVGGLVGNAYGTINNSYSTVNATSPGSGVGGLVGVLSGIISNSYSTGKVIGANPVGGFVGHSTGTITNSYWDMDSSGQTQSAGDAVGKSTINMKKIGTFVSWNISTNLTNNGNSYPYLAWQAGNNSVVWRINYDPSKLYECGILNIANTTYVLQNNVSTAGVCFNITAPNITLDGNGYNLDGSYAQNYTILIRGIYSNNNGVKNVTVKNVSFSGFGVGIEFIGVNDSLIEDIRIQDVVPDGYAKDGISLANSSNNIIRNNNINISSSSAGVAIYETLSHNNVISGNIFTATTNTRSGIDSHNSRNVTFYNNSFSNFNRGLLLSGAVPGLAVSSNFVNQNSFDNCSEGIVLWRNTSGNILLNNNFTNMNNHSITTIWFDSFANLSTSGVNYLIYNNSYGQVSFIDNNFSHFMTFNKSLVFGSDIIIGQNIVNVSSVLLGSSENISFTYSNYTTVTIRTVVKVNSSANITFNNNDYVGQYPLRLRKILNNGNACAFCNNLTGLDESVIRFNVSNFGSGNISIGKSVNNSDDVSLDSGWNMIALTLQGNASGDRNVSLEMGWNLIGYSSESEFNVSLMRFTNASGYSASWADAARAGKVQKYISYYDANESKNKYLTVGTGKTEMDQSGYWIYATEAGTLTLPSVGGSAVGETYALSDITFSNGTTEKNISEAVSAGWVNDLVYAWDPATCVGDNCWNLMGQDILPEFNSWDGYFVKGLQENITMLRQD